MSGFQNDAGTVQQEAGFGWLGRFWCESFNAGMTAHANGGRASATPIDSMFCTFTTVASANDSAVLPPVSSFLGGALSICVTNAGANPMQVFAQGSDTINGVAGATGVSVMANSIVWFNNTEAGAWRAQGLGGGFSGSQATFNFADALTAHAGGGQGSATAIATSIARFTTVANNGDSAVLMAAAPGLNISVINAGAKILNVFPNGTDQINSLGASNAFAVPPGGVAEFFTTAAGVWHTVLSGSGAPQQAYNTVATVNASITLTGAQLTGGTEEVTVDMTGTQAGATTLTLPTVALLVAAMTVAGVNPQPGMTYELDIIGRDGTHTYTVTTAAGWTLQGTMTVTNQMRKFYVTLTSLSAAVLQSIGTFTVGAA